MGAPVETPPPAGPAPSLSRPTGVQTASYLLAAAAIFCVLHFRLLPAALAALMVFELVQTLTPRLLGGSRSGRARMFTVGALAFLIAAAIGAAIAGLVLFARSDAGSLSALLSRMAEILENWRATLPAWLVTWLPADIDTVRETVTGWLREHAAELQTAGREVLRGVVQVLIGLVIGALAALDDARPHGERQPLEAALLARLDTIADVFRRVVFAQVKIAAVNAVLTGIYLIVLLPMAGVHVPLQKTLVAVTFAAGLIPVAGNLISNTVIVTVSLGHSFWAGVASLVFLVLIHKLEYFLNARIVGNQIHARAWELLASMLVMESIFGIGGLVAAPIVYAYLKRELGARGLV